MFFCKCSALFLFCRPVKYTDRGCEKYYQTIRYPIDLETMEKKNNHHAYRSIELFNRDMQRMFANCHEFNKVRLDQAIHCRVRILLSTVSCSSKSMLPSIRN